MITDKLLAFADGKTLSGTADSDTIDFGKGSDEVARTMNVVAQIDDAGTLTPSVEGSPVTVAATLKGTADGTNWVALQAWPAKAIAKGARFVDFAKLPLGMRPYSQLKLALTVSGGTIAGGKYSAWLTPSAEASL